MLLWPTPSEVGITSSLSLFKYDGSTEHVVQGHLEKTLNKNVELGAATL